LLIISNVAKYCQQTFMAPLPGMDCNSILSSDVKKYQQAARVVLIILKTSLLDLRIPPREFHIKGEYVATCHQYHTMPHRIFYDVFERE